VCVSLAHVAVLVRPFLRSRLAVPDAHTVSIPILFGLNARLDVVHLTVRLLAGAQIAPPAAVAHREVHHHIGAGLMAQHLLRAEVAAVVVQLVDLLERSIVD